MFMHSKGSAKIANEFADDRGPADRKHHVVDQLLGVAVEEGMAERWVSHHQGFHVSPQASVLDAGLSWLY